MAAYPVIWSSDIKSNITNRLSDPENLVSGIYYKIFPVIYTKL